ncbi:MAG: hypothetical protein H0U59_00180 [Gemmatimonadaceae bacterium]|nr:hypothetical protein [Gemmatimonadaceae bacterium]
MKRFAALASASVLALAACSDSPTSPATRSPDGLSVSAAKSSSRVAEVTVTNDAGPGSFREAIAAAIGNPDIKTIRLDKKLGVISISSPLVFTGTQAVTIEGNGGIVDGSSLGALQNALVISGGGDLVINDFTVRNAPGVGMAVLIPSDATGIVSVTLDEVVARGNGLHGVLINDQTGYLTDPESTSPAGSDASLRVRVNRTTFEGNGDVLIDQDGFRINEGGLGDLIAQIDRTIVLNNGGDGIELDERGPGSAIFSLEQSRLVGNGFFTAEDYDDGIDVDEAGTGNIEGRFQQVVVNGNFEQGVDLNENNEGDLRVVMNQVEASDNAEEGIEFEEDDDFAGGGDIIALLTNITTLRNGANDGDAGLKLREKGAGNLFARIVNATSSDNLIAGILLREDAAGNLDGTLVNAVANGNADDGIRFDENGAGNLEARIQRASAANNADAGFAAEQHIAAGSTDTGILRIQGLTATGNGGDPVEVDAGVVVDQKGN